MDAHSQSARMQRAAGRVVRALAPRVVLLGWLGLAGALLACGSRLWWVLELCVHFRPWYLPLLLAGAACALWLRHRFVAILMVLVATLDLLAVMPAWRGVLRRDDAPPQLRLVVFNLDVRNTSIAPVVQFLARTRADAVVLLEVGEQWRAPLASLQAIYPYQLLQPRADPFGLALLSAHPCAPCDIVETASDLPAVLGRLAWHNDHLWIAAVHALPPISGAWTRRRDAYLLKMSQRLAALEGRACSQATSTRPPGRPAIEHC
jgi:endonuclease/exonuclease/phosphatase (EEP) superfamily protein YafD